MRVLGLDLHGLRASATGKAPAEPAPIGTLVLLDADGRIDERHQAETLPDLAAAVGGFAGDDPFLLGVNLPTVAPRKGKKARPVDNLVRRRFGFRAPPLARVAAAEGAAAITAEALLAGLAAAGQPCLPYPDRDKRKPGLAEVQPGLTLKALLWQASPLPESRSGGDLAELFRAFGAPDYRLSRLPARTGWADQAAVLDRVLRLIDGAPGFDVETPRNALARAESLAATEGAASLMDAALIAGTARRYLEAPEESLFLGEQETGYVILPANGFIRRLASDTRPTHGRLFPKASLRQRLGSNVKLRATDLLSMPGKPQRLEATFSAPPGYEFENVDEMLWWKHTRHVDGDAVPTEGLQDLVVSLDKAPGNGHLKLVRSRHRTLSFRFEPPTAWRHHVPTRDGKTYAFRILRATYEILPGSD